MTWLLYGANGYTGELVARLAVSVGHRPVLAGRSTSVRDLAEELELEHRLFDLAEPAGVDAGLAGVQSILHCAGPFSRTAAAVVDGCLRNGVHYADLTGEIDVFEAIYARHDEAVAAGVCLVPGVGFDVVPTDHLLAVLHGELPDATHADVALVGRGGFSAGTLRTVVEGMRRGGLVRSAGEIVPVPTAHRRLTIQIDNRPTSVYSIPLGDVSSGFYATGIPHITNYTNLPAGSLMSRSDGILRRFLKPDRIHHLVDTAIARFVEGPTDARRESTRSDVWAELRNDHGDVVRAALRVPSTYDFTAHSALHAIGRIEAQTVVPGAWTPSQAFGIDFCGSIPGIAVHRLEAQPG